MQGKGFAALGLLGLLLSCADGPVSPAGGGDGAARVDLAATVPESTAARCQDGEDNDKDGVIDCADQDCWGFGFCRDRGVPDRPYVDAPGADLTPPPDAGPAADLVTGPDLAAPDLSAPDLPAPDLPAPDLPAPDLAIPDAAAPDVLPACTTHCDCAQGQFCYLGKCTKDPSMAVYCCSKKPCPPGRWCVDAAGKKGTCAEDASHKCNDACDCGPAHCCKAGVCVKDTLDPFRPGGVAVGAACKEGTDATYCCSAPECHAGRFAYQGIPGVPFRCYSRASASTSGRCGETACYGTACNCPPGQVCVDSVSNAPPGRACLLLSGGSCVPTAVAEALYSFKKSDVLPCCTSGCVKGAACDAGWRSDARYAYVRQVGICGACGDGKCNAGESPATCPMDCSCGDGRCALSEVGLCAQDCGSCGDGKCAVWETPVTCAQDCNSCGDGWCSGNENIINCSQDCVGLTCIDEKLYPRLPRVCGDGVCGGAGCHDPESCASCPQDCGKCDAGWIQRLREPAWGHADLRAVWGSSATNVFAVGDDATILRFDGIKWLPMIVGIKSAAGKSPELFGLWGSSATDVLAVGHIPSGSSSWSNLVLRYNGQDWSYIKTNMHAGFVDVWGLAGVGEIIATNDGKLVRLVGHKLSTINGVIGASYSAIWGSSYYNIYAVGQIKQGSSRAAFVHYFDGGKWHPGKLGPSPLRAVWGASHTDVFLGGDHGTIIRGSRWTWSKMSLPTNASIRRIWGTSSTNVFAVGQWGAILRFDGKKWTTVVTGHSERLSGLWGTSATNVLAVGDRSTILRRQGTKWSRVVGGGGYQLNAVWGSSPTSTVVVGYTDYASFYRRRGLVLTLNSKTMVRSYTGAGRELHGVWGTSPTNLYVVGRRYGSNTWSGEVLRSGSSVPWHSVVQNAGDQLHDIWGSSPSEIHAAGGTVGGAGVVARFDGLAWKVGPLGNQGPVTGLWGTSAGDVYAVNSGQLLRYNGSAWTAGKLGVGLQAVDLWKGASSRVFVVGSGQTSAGTWATAGQLSGSSWKLSNLGTQGRAVGVWGRSDSDVYAVGHRGTIHHFNGSTWSPVRLDLREVSSNTYRCPRFTAVGGTPAGDVYVVGDQSTILRRCPGGKCP